MAAPSHSTRKSEHSAGWLLRAWIFLVRQEIRLARWMVAHGMRPTLATALLWLLKIALVVIIGYALFWVALVLAIVFVGMKILRHADLDAKPYSWEWRQGFHGFGLYDHVGHRIDPYDPTADD